jgi:hypothetical protein
VNVAIADARTTSPDFLDLPAELAALLVWHARAGNMHPVERSGTSYAVGQDPSVRGRKRQNRSPASEYRIDEIELSPAVIRNEDRAAYCDSLDNACVSNNHAGTARLIAESVLRHSTSTSMRSVWLPTKDLPRPLGK